MQFSTPATRDWGNAQGVRVGPHRHAGVLEFEVCGEHYGLRVGGASIGLDGGLGNTRFK